MKSGSRVLGLSEKLEGLSFQSQCALTQWLHGALPRDPHQACKVWSHRLRLVEQALGREVTAIAAVDSAALELMNPLWQRSDVDRLAYTMTTLDWLPMVSSRTWESLMVCLVWASPGRTEERHLVESIVALAGGQRPSAALNRLSSLNRPPGHIPSTVERELQTLRAAFSLQPHHVAHSLATQIEGQTPFWELLGAAFNVRRSPGFSFEAALVAQWSWTQMQSIARCAQKQQAWDLWEVFLGHVVIGDNPGRVQGPRCPPGLDRMFKAGLELGWVPSEEIGDRLGFAREGVKGALAHAVSSHKAMALSKAWALDCAFDNGDVTRARL